MLQKSGNIKNKKTAIKNGGLFACLLMLCLTPAMAVVIPESEEDQKALYDQMTQDRDTLKQDLVQIQSEQLRCNKAKKNWTIATVAGGVGVVGSTVGIIVQHNTQQGKKIEIKEKSDELSQKKQDLTNLK